MSNDVKKELESGKEILLQSDEALKFVNNPIGKAHFKAGSTNDEKKYLDKIVCNDCGKTYTRSNKSKHLKTNHHQTYMKINRKWRTLILG